MKEKLIKEIVFSHDGKTISSKTDYNNDLITCYQYEYQGSSVVETKVIKSQTMKKFNIGK